MKIKYAIYIVKTANLGDNAQGYVLEDIYDKMGIPKEDVVFLSRENIEIVLQECDHLILPMVAADIMYLDFVEACLQLGVQDKISFLPISIGQTRWTVRNEEGLRRFENVIHHFISPIGCRDYDSASLYSALGYEVYVNGCITNTFPVRKAGNYNDIYIIDIPEKLENYIPDEIKDKAIRLTQKYDYVSGEAESHYKVCKARYELLRDTAKLVITYRYHIATPCVAMGIPVIMVENCDPNQHWTFDQRFPSLNPYIPYYKKEEFSQINWEPEIILFEEEKEIMRNRIISRINNIAGLIEYKANQDSFFAPSKNKYWTTFKENRYKIDNFGFNTHIKRLFLPKGMTKFRYYLYGLSKRYQDEGRCVLLEYMERNYPDASFIGFVDANKSGTDFLGKRVLSPDEMIIDSDTYCFCVAFTANEGVEALFKQMGFNTAHLWTMPEELLFYFYHL